MRPSADSPSVVPVTVSEEIESLRLKLTDRCREVRKLVDEAVTTVSVEILDLFASQ